jgi:hypothetical protein
MDARKKWWLTLKVGDVVCDCRYRHVEIVEIREVTEGKGNWGLLTWAIAMFSVQKASSVTDWLDRKGETEPIERLIYFADGSRCFASKCLDPAEGCDHA